MGTADQDYFLDDAGNLTTNPNDAHQLLIRGGQDIPKEVADKYGIGKVAQTEEEAAADETVEEKAAKPSADKSAKPTKNKGVK